MPAVPPPTPTTSSKYKRDNHILFAAPPPFSPGVTEQVINHCSLHLQQPSDLLKKADTFPAPSRLWRAPFCVNVHMCIYTHIHIQTTHTQKGVSAHFVFIIAIRMGRNHERWIMVGTFYSLIFPWQQIINHSILFSFLSKIIIMIKAAVSVSIFKDHF